MRFHSDFCTASFKKMFFRTENFFPFQTFGNNFSLYSTKSPSSGLKRHSVFLSNDIGNCFSFWLRLFSSGTIMSLGEVALEPQKSFQTFNPVWNKDWRRFSVKSQHFGHRIYHNFFSSCNQFLQEILSQLREKNTVNLCCGTKSKNFN